MPSRRRPPPLVNAPGPQCDGPQKEEMEFHSFVFFFSFSKWEKRKKKRKKSVFLSCGSFFFLKKQESLVTVKRVSVCMFGGTVSVLRGEGPQKRRPGVLYIVNIVI
jgi:hypothetical protein